MIDSEGREKYKLSELLNTTARLQLDVSDADDVATGVANLVEDLHALGIHPRSLQEEILIEKEQVGLHHLPFEKIVIPVMLFSV